MNERAGPSIGNTFVSEGQAVHAFTWEELASLTETIASAMRADDLHPTVIIGILRGGAFPALVLSHILSVRSVYTVTSKLTVDESPRARRQPVQIEGIDSLPRLDDEVVAVVDDVTNTGGTLTAVKEKILRVARPKRLVTAALLWDTVPLDERGILGVCAADFYGLPTHAWVNFPWET